MVGAEILGDAGGAGSEAEGAELLGLGESEDASFAEAILQAAVLVVDEAETGDFVLEVGEDLSVGYDRHDADAVELYLVESFSFRVLTSDAAVALT